MSEVRKNYLYTKDHEWVRFEDTFALIGITDYAQSELGEIVFVDVPTVGEEVKQFETFGSIEAVKTVADLNMPVSGIVEKINPTLDEHPEWVNKQPYMDGYLIKIIPSNFEEESKNLMTAEEYSKFIGE